jgi:hypothetical protein
VSRYTTAQRSAILRGARDACATAEGLQVILAELRSESDELRGEATGLRRESAGLRGRAQAARANQKRS